MPTRDRYERTESDLFSYDKSEAELDAQYERTRLKRDENERDERLRAGDWVPGWLQRAQKAPFHHLHGESDSFYVRLKTSHGIREIWGKDLERALEQSRSNARIGDAVAVRITRIDRFVATLDDGRQEEREYRHFEVERAVFVVKQQKAARQILREPITDERAKKEGRVASATTLIVSAADMLADAYRLPPRYRQTFIDKVRAAAGISRYDAPAADFQPSGPEEEARAKGKDFQEGAWLRGRLLAAAEARYHHDPNNSESYYVTLLTSYGKQTIWGKDLQRAVEESKSKVKTGDQVAVRITLPARWAIDQHDVRSPVTTFKHYEVETEEHIARRERAAERILAKPVDARRMARDGRVVTGSYLLTAGAELLAKSNELEGHEKDAFVKAVQAAAAVPNMELRASRTDANQHNAPQTVAPPAQAGERQGFARE